MGLEFEVTGAFEALKKTYEVHTDVSDVTIVGVLMQKGHPVAYESRKLNDTERRYIIQEKEMTTVVHYFEYGGTTYLALGS